MIPDLLPAVMAELPTESAVPPGRTGLPPAELVEVLGTLDLPYTRNAILQLLLTNTKQHEFSNYDTVPS